MARRSVSPAPPETSEPEEPALRRQSSGEQAAAYIRRMIFDGRLLPRSRVPQDDIAKALGISRIPVREALIALEREGWVTNELHRGMFVTPLDESSVRDHYELFGLIYGFAVRMAIARDSEATLAGRLALVLKQLTATDNVSEIIKLAWDFQATVIDAAASPPTRVLMRSMSGWVPGNFFAVVPKSIEIERRGLAAVVRAAKQGDADKAADAYATMMRRMADQVVALFRERQLFERDPEPKARPA